jgi:steroid 5-alpha reductase family enzyme
MRKRAFTAIAIAYAAAFVAAVITVAVVPTESPLVRAFWADVVATCVIFGFSVRYDNSSFYDAYWSVAPVPIALYWILIPEAGDANALRQLVVGTLLSVWAVRLTYNWAGGWTGLDH